jgi:hypothetical protein
MFRNYIINLHKETYRDVYGGTLICCQYHCKEFLPGNMAPMRHIHNDNGRSKSRRLTSHSLLTVRRPAVCQSSSNLVTENIKYLYRLSIASVSLSMEPTECMLSNGPSIPDRVQEYQFWLYIKTFFHYLRCSFRLEFSA